LGGAKEQTDPYFHGKLKRMEKRKAAKVTMITAVTSLYYETVMTAKA